VSEDAPRRGANQPEAPADPARANSEIARLNKIIRVLMDRTERSMSAQGSDFGLFQTTIMLEQQVRLRTAELSAALLENERINRSLSASEAKFRRVVEQSLVGIATIEDGQFTYSNAKFDEIFGYGANEVRDLSPIDVVAESDRDLVAEAIRKRLGGEVDEVAYFFQGLRKDGALVDIECHGSAMDLLGRRVLVTVVSDITERTCAERKVRALQEQLQDQANHDALTGLCNRRYLEESLARELACATRMHDPVSIILGDLDKFKSVNDRYGHLAGDEVLRSIGELMTRQTRGTDITCRYGGEEFLVVLPGMAQETAIGRAELLRREIAVARVRYHTTEIALTASFGIATFPRHGTTVDELIAAADDAMYAAKAAGRNRVVLNPGEAGGSVDRLSASNGAAPVPPPRPAHQPAAPRP
jgi:diguanylate cyclase (GGDEF)-like protein/PAS domain S-box-containing protein